MKSSGEKNTPRLACPIIVQYRPTCMEVRSHKKLHIQTDSQFNLLGWEFRASLLHVMVDELVSLTLFLFIRHTLHARKLRVFWYSDADVEDNSKSNKVKV